MQPDKKTRLVLFFSQYVLLKKWRKWILFVRNEISCKFFFFVTLWYGPVDHPTVPVWYCWYRRDCSLFCWTVCALFVSHTYVDNDQDITEKPCNHYDSCRAQHLPNDCYMFGREITKEIGCEVSGGLIWLIYGSRVIFSRGSVLCLRA